MSSYSATQPNQPASDRIERHVWVIAGVVILGMIMSILDTTIVNVALHTLWARPAQPDRADPVGDHRLPAVARRGDPGNGLGGAALRGQAGVHDLAGAVHRRLGAVRLSSSTTSLVLFRVLQGAGGGMIMPVAQMIMAQVAGPQRMGRVMGIVSMPAMLAPILGPVVGGLILQNLHWSWIFFVNVPIGVLAFVARLADAAPDRLRRGRAPGRGRPRAAPDGRSRRSSTASASSARARAWTRPKCVVPILAGLGADGAVLACTRCASSARCSTSACTPTACSRAPRSPPSASARRCSGR